MNVESFAINLCCIDVISFRFLTSPLWSSSWDLCYANHTYIHLSHLQCKILGKSGSLFPCCPKCIYIKFIANCIHFYTISYLPINLRPNVSYQPPPPITPCSSYNIKAIQSATSASYWESHIAYNFKDIDCHPKYTTCHWGASEWKRIPYFMNNLRIQGVLLGHNYSAKWKMFNSHN